MMNGFLSVSFYGNNQPNHSTYLDRVMETAESSRMLSLPQGMGLSESSTQVTACQRCRKQKLRCSREFPKCKRCNDNKFTCTYPPPPDRKLLAAQRALRLKQQKEKEKAQETVSPPSLGRSPPQSFSEQPQNEESRSSRSKSIESQASAHFPGPVSPRVKLPPYELAMFLIDTLFNAQHITTSLMYHKPTFLANFRAGKVPDHVLFSMYAFSTIFAIGSPHARAHLPIGITSEDLVVQGRDWALASMERLIHSEQPSLEVIQSCQNLAMYWFSNGHANKTNLYFHYAFRSCLILCCHEHDNADNRSITPIQGEIKRRHFWSCWVAHCIGQANAYFKLSPYEDCGSLPLPCDEDSFHQQSPIITQYLDVNGVAQVVGDTDPKSSPSVFGELMKAYGQWWDITHFIKQYTDPSTHDSAKRMSELLRLDRRLETFHDNLPPDYRYIDPNSFAKSKDPYHVWTVHCLYHLCTLALHSSVVPLFSCTPMDPNISKKLIRMCAEQAIKNSLILADLANVFVNMQLDCTKLSSLCAFAFSMASSIQFKSLGAQGKLRSHGFGRLHGGITIIKALKEIWQPLQSLWEELDILFRCGRIDINNLHKSQPGVGDTSPNFDQIMSHQILPIDVSGSAKMYSFVRDGFNQVAIPRRKSEQRSKSRHDTSASQSPMETHAPMPQQYTLPLHGDQRGSISGESSREFEQQQYGQQQQNVPNYDYSSLRQPQEMYQVNPMTSLPPSQPSYTVPSELPIKEESRIPQSHHDPNGVTTASSYGPWPAATVVDFGSGFQTVMEGREGASNLWWEQSFESMELDSAGCLITGLPPSDNMGFQ